jgi:hypothetical protein
MSTSLKSSRNTIFHPTELGAEKNGRRICPINDDLAWAYTLATPQNSLCTRRSHRHDA